MCRKNQMILFYCLDSFLTCMCSQALAFFFFTCKFQKNNTKGKKKKNNDGTQIIVKWALVVTNECLKKKTFVIIRVRDQQIECL